MAYKKTVPVCTEVPAFSKFVLCKNCLVVGHQFLVSVISHNAALFRLLPRRRARSHRAPAVAAGCEARARREAGMTDRIGGANAAGGTGEPA